VRCSNPNCPHRHWIPAGAMPLSNSTSAGAGGGMGINISSNGDPSGLQEHLCSIVDGP